MEQEKLVAFVIPYFGKLPNYFPVFLRSCEINRQFDWLLFTDDHTEYDYPDNVKVSYGTFAELKQRIEARFSFPVALPSPKKLCDFKPAYGYIFEEELKPYRYWGHCDIDLVLGDLGAFLDETVLGSYQKHFYLGHMSIYENSPEMRTLFMKGHPRKENETMLYGYRDVLGNPGNMVFDEWSDTVETINHVAESQGVQINPSFPMFDIRPFRSRFYSTIFDPAVHTWIHNPTDNYVVAWENGKLWRCSLDNQTKKIKKQEILYAHFQKRKMQWGGRDLTFPCIFFFPNQIKPCAEITEAMIRRALRLAKVRRWFRIDEIRHRLADFAALWKHRFRKYIRRTKS